MDWELVTGLTPGDDGSDGYHVLQDDGASGHVLQDDGGGGGDHVHVHDDDGGGDV